MYVCVYLFVKVTVGLNCNESIMANRFVYMYFFCLTFSVVFECLVVLWGIRYETNLNSNQILPYGNLNNWSVPGSLHYDIPKSAFKCTINQNSNPDIFQKCSIKCKLIKADKTTTGKLENNFHRGAWQNFRCKEIGAIHFWIGVWHLDLIINEVLLEITKHFVNINEIEIKEHNSCTTNSTIYYTNGKTPYIITVYGLSLLMLNVYGYAKCLY